MKPYSVFTPEFNPLSGGIRVMWGLFGWLLAKGQLAITNGRWQTPFTAIYPEIAHGNPLGGERVIRYVLNKPGVMSSFGVPGPSTFDKNDEIYVFSKLYDTFGVDDDHILFLPILNLHLFKDQKKDRDNTCFFVGKGKDMGLHPKDSIKIDRTVSSDQSQLADLFNMCSVLYTYENPTALVEIARLCGCRVVFFPEGSMTKFTREELEVKYEPTMMGVSFGLKEKIELDTKRFRKHYINMIKTFERKLDKFIERSQL